MLTAHVNVPESQIADFCRRWGVQEFALFGSVLRDDFRPDSDVDVLYTMKPDARHDWDVYWGMKEELERLYGRPVDLVKKKLIQESPNWVRRRHILANHRVIYAGG